MSMNRLNLHCRFQTGGIPPRDSLRVLRTTNVLNLRKTKEFWSVHLGCSCISSRSFLTADFADGTDKSHCVYL